MVISRSLARNGWTAPRLLGAAVVVALGACLTAEAWLDLGRLALRPQALAGMAVVLGVAGWMVWVRRARFRLCRPGGHLLAPVLVLVGYLIYAAGSGEGAALARHVGAWLVMAGCGLAVCRELLRQFAAALGALVYLLPLPIVMQAGWPEPVHAVLGELTWTIGQLLAQSEDGGVAAERTVPVPDAVSGLQVLLALCAVSYGFAFGRPLRRWVRVLMLVLSPVAAGVCSLIGLAITVWLVGRIAGAEAYWVVIGQWGVVTVAMLALVALLQLLAWASVSLRAYPLASADR